MRKLSEFDYKLDTYTSNDQILEDLRENFVNSYPVKYIRNQMTLDDYCEGKGKKDTFCNRLERELIGLGSIKGATASKFGIYYSQEKHKYLINKVWRIPQNNPNLKLSFDKLRNAIADLIELGKAGDEEAIQKHPLATMVKMKILSVYYPDKYLNIFSDRMLNFFTYQFYEDDLSKNLNRFEKQKLLLDLKSEDKAMQNWNNIKYGNYLYHLFPQAFALGKESKEQRQEKYQLLTPGIDNKTIIKEPIVYEKQAVKFNSRKVKKYSQGISKIDYVQKQKTNIVIGYTGEKQVLEYERKRLSNYPDLQRQIKWQSQESDAIGYDILSYDKDGTERQIEVKSTNAQPSDKFHFVLTENERQHALKLTNYWIYYVFSIDNQPTIYKIKNPFKDDLVQIEPIKYKVNIKVKDM